MQSNNPFPERLKQARKEIPISQKELGIRIGMDPGSASSRMNHYEKGRHMPDFETLDRIAKKLGKPVAYFFCEDEVTAEIISLLSPMTDKERQAVLNGLKVEKNSNDK